MIRLIPPLLIVWSLLLTPQSTWGQEPAEIPFPLPTREQRLAEEAQNPQTPVKQLMELLNDINPNVRLGVTRELGKRGDGEVIKALQDADDAADAQLKAASQVAVLRLQTQGQTPDEQAHSLQPFLSSPDESLQLEAILALENIRSPIAADALLEYAKKNRNFFNQARVLRDLAKLGERRAVPLLAEFDRDLFNLDPNIAVGGIGQARMTREDIDALGEAYWRLRFAPMTVEERMKAFDDELTSGRVVGGLRLRNVLAQMGEEIFPYLRRFAADKDKSLGTRLWSIELLGIMRDKEAGLILQQVMKEPELPEELTEAAFMSVIRISGEGASNQLKQQLQAMINQQATKKISSTLRNVLWSTYYLAEDKQIDVAFFDEELLPYLKLGSSVVATIARTIGGEESVEPLIQMAKDPQAPDDMSRQSIRRLAITSLGFIGARIQDKDDKILLFLLSMSYDKDPLTRIPAVQALGRAAGRAAVPVLLDLAKQEQDGTALHFEISGIYKVGGAAAVEALQILQKQAQEKNNAWMLELSEEALLRLEREKRAGEKP